MGLNTYFSGAETWDLKGQEKTQKTELGTHTYKMGTEQYAGAVKLWKDILFMLSGAGWEAKNSGCEVTSIFVKSSEIISAFLLLYVLEEPFVMSIEDKWRKIWLQTALTWGRRTGTQSVQGWYSEKD